MKKIFMIMVFMIPFFLTMGFSQTVDSVGGQYGPWEDEICTICLEDGNYNFYSYLTDSLHLDEPIVKMYNAIVKEINPKLSIGVFLGYSFTDNNEWKPLKNFNGGISYGTKMSFGLTNNIYFTGSYLKLLNDSYEEIDDGTWFVTQYHEYNINVSSYSYGIGFKYNVFDIIIPHISYSLCHTNTSTIYNVTRVDYNGYLSQELDMNLVENQLGNGIQINFGVEVPIHHKLTLDVNTTISKTQKNYINYRDFFWIPNTNFISATVGINYEF